MKSAIDEIIDNAISIASEQAFQIEDIPCFPQEDNKYAPLSSCFNTSNAMCIQYCLTSIGKSKEDIGCSSDMQLEDYIFEFINGSETTEYIKSNTSTLGNLVNSPKRRIYYDIECFVFNYLMNPLGFKAVFKTDLTYEEICSWLLYKKLPGIIGGNFKSVSSVEGHMNCLVGYNKVGLKEFIVNDPYGNALSGYTDKNGSYKHYGTRFYLEYGFYRVILLEKVI
mgnify:CR=1 FL=1